MNADAENLIKDLTNRLIERAYKQGNNNGFWRGVENQRMEQRGVEANENYKKGYADALEAAANKIDKEQQNVLSISHDVPSSTWKETVKTLDWAARRIRALKLMA